MEVLTDTEIRLRDAASKKILIEIALLKAIEARNAVSLDSVLKQLQALRDGTGGQTFAGAAASLAPAPASSTTRQPKTVRTESVEISAPVAMASEPTIPVAA